MNRASLVSSVLKIHFFYSAAKIIQLNTQDSGWFNNKPFMNYSIRKCFKISLICFIFLLRVYRWGPCGGARPFACREDARWGATVGRPSAPLVADGGWVVHIVSAGRWPHAQHSHDTRAEDHLRLCHLSLRLSLHADCALLPYPAGSLPQHAHLHLGWWSRWPGKGPVRLHTGIGETHTQQTQYWQDTPS